MNWRPHTEKPQLENGTVALIAISDDEGEVFLYGIYMWCDAAWVSEEDSSLLRRERYWWALESEIVSEIPTGTK